MLFVTVEDFLTQASTIPPLTREEETALARRMAQGDTAARETLVRGYLPLVAAFVRRAPAAVRTLDTVYAGIAALERAVDGFDFQQTGETFAHRLGWALRQTVTRQIAERT